MEMKYYLVNSWKHGSPVETELVEPINLGVLITGYINDNYSVTVSPITDDSVEP